MSPDLKLKAAADEVAAAARAVIILCWNQAHSPPSSIALAMQRLDQAERAYAGERDAIPTVVDVVGPGG